jgi:hypothetical protein
MIGGIITIKITTMILILTKPKKKENIDKERFYEGIILISQLLIESTSRDSNAM